ncbi:hypothetical protein TCAL_04191 [Tigriopus californicus]|uniref:RanBP-type and C3HC4-type zinc finger-containing protein 1 n=1 Tax=Tigriopus californicus TaxID=6832 RepID=A0A553N9P0_TIGCA|nr:hypothetical protein TCAL_04191 [Tigriopus californicus]
MKIIKWIRRKGQKSSTSERGYSPKTLKRFDSVGSFDFCPGFQLNSVQQPSPRLKNKDRPTEEELQKAEDLLRIKYNLLPSDSPPSVRRNQNLSAVPGPQLPAAPHLDEFEIVPKQRIGQFLTVFDLEETNALTSIGQGEPTNAVESKKFYTIDRNRIQEDLTLGQNKRDTFSSLRSNRRPDLLIQPERPRRLKTDTLPKDTFGRKPALPGVSHQPPDILANALVAKLPSDSKESSSKNGNESRNQVQIRTSPPQSAVPRTKKRYSCHQDNKNPFVEEEPLEDTTFNGHISKADPTLHTPHSSVERIIKKPRENENPFNDSTLTKVPLEVTEKGVSPPRDETTTTAENGTSPVLKRKPASSPLPSTKKMPAPQPPTFSNKDANQIQLPVVAPVRKDSHQKVKAASKLFSQKATTGVKQGSDFSIQSAIAKKHDQTNRDKGSSGTEQKSCNPLEEAIRNVESLQRELSLETQFLEDLRLNPKSTESETPSKVERVRYQGSKTKFGADKTIMQPYQIEPHIAPKLPIVDNLFSKSPLSQKTEAAVLEESVPSSKETAPLTKKSRDQIIEEEPHYKVPKSPPVPVCGVPIDADKKEDQAIYTSIKKTRKKNNRELRLLMYVEDREEVVGPLEIQANPEILLAHFKIKIKDMFNIPIKNQLWMFKKKPMLDDEKSLSEYEVRENESKLYLYLQRTTRETEKATEPKVIMNEYRSLDDVNLIPNVEEFTCEICYSDYEPGEGVVLRECLHTFCRDCLIGTITHATSVQVQCPFKNDEYTCDMNILEREMKELVSEDVLKRREKQSLKELQTGDEKIFQCRADNCEGWFFLDDDALNFKCPQCQALNCVSCRAVHTGVDCKQYQEQEFDSKNPDSMKTMEWINDLKKSGEALNCPNCNVLLLKKWGCDWLKCSYCKTEICWVTQQRRWGPGGRGDTSEGCKCMADGRTKCHPKCNYCH